MYFEFNVHSCIITIIVYTFEPIYWIFSITSKCNFRICESTSKLKNIRSFASFILENKKNWMTKNIFKHKTNKAFPLLMISAFHQRRVEKLMFQRLFSKTLSFYFWYKKIEYNRKKEENLLQMLSTLYFIFVK